MAASQDKELMNYSKTLTKDYISLARDYGNQEPYRDLSSDPSCVLCKVNTVTTVFFPCGHKCTCRECIDKNNIGKPGTEGSWNFCAICCDEIKHALEHDGTEVGRYWKWVRDVKPYIPPGFIKTFTKRSTARIRKLGIEDMGVQGDYDDEGEDGGGGGGRRKSWGEGGSKACLIS